jgi:DNA-binding MarR family transcriptional regulator
MNANFFGLKRAFHGTLRITRPSLTKLGLTAARFDLLYALPQDGQRFEQGMRQSDLRRQIGVSRPTVSRMLASLEQLGLVRRQRFAYRRQRVVALTRRGLGLVRKAASLFISRGWAQLALDTALGQPGDRWCDDFQCLVHMETLQALLNKIRAAVGDFARLYYPWHPDD